MTWEKQYANVGVKLSPGKWRWELKIVTTTLAFHRPLRSTFSIDRESFDKFRYQLSLLSIKLLFSFDRGFNWQIRLVFVYFKLTILHRQKTSVMLE